MDKDEKYLIAKKNKAAKNTDKLIYAEAIDNLAIFYRKRNQYAKALKEYELAANVVKEAKPYNEIKWGFFNKMIGEIHMHLANFEKARQFLDIYLAIAEKTGDLKEQQRGKASLGRMYLLQGQSTTDEIERIKYMKEAKAASQESLYLCKRLDGINDKELEDMQARAILNMGVAQESFDNGILMIDHALSICIENKFYKVLIKCYSAKAEAHRVRDEYDEALECHEKAIDLINRLKLGNVKTCEILMLKAEIYCEMSDFEKAKKTLIEAKKKKTTSEQDDKAIKAMLNVVSEICKKLPIVDSVKTTDPPDHATLSKLYEELGDACCKVRIFSQAIVYYHKALWHAIRRGVSGKDLAPFYVSLYKTYEDMSMYTQALEYVDKEYELIKDNPKEIYVTMLNKAEILFLAKMPIEQIEKACAEALKVAKLCEASEPASNDQVNKVKNVQKILKEYSEKYPKLMEMVRESMKTEKDNAGSSGSSNTKLTPEDKHTRKRKIETNNNNSSNGDTTPQRKRNDGGTPSSHAVSNSHDEHNNENTTSNTPSSSNGPSQNAKVSALTFNDTSSAFKKMENKYHYFLAEMIVLDNEPASIVNRPGFTRFMKHLLPLYEIPSSSYLSQTIIPDMDARICSKIKADISETDKISLTSVTWQCSDSKTYLRITAHWLSPEFKLHHGVCAIKCLPASRPENGTTKPNVVDICGIAQDKIHLIVHGTNADLFHKIEVDSATCFIHLLHKAMTESIEAHPDVMDMIVAARQLVSHVNSSSAIKNALKDIQRQQNLPEHELVEDNETRWNSTYYMAERLLKAKVAICLFVSRCDNFFPKLTVAHWSLMGQWVELLKMFENVAKEMSSDVACISEVIPIIGTLQKYLEDAETLQRTSDLLHLGTSLKNMLKESLSSLDKSCFKIATFLDPRFKAGYFSPQDAEKVKLDIIGQVKPSCKVDRRTSLSLQSSKNAIGKEIENYLRAELNNNDPYKWWSDNADIYPNLAKLAKNYLSAPCSAVFNEPLFSEAGLAYENKRCDILSHKDGARRMLLQYNLPFVNLNID